MSRWLMSKDRGQNVRREHEWKELIGSVFDHFGTNVLTGLIRISYVHIAIEARP